MENMQPMKERMDGTVFTSCQSRRFALYNMINIYICVNMIKVLLPVCTLTWPVNNYVSRQGKGINKRNENTIISNKIIVLIDTFVAQLTLFA